MTLLTDFHSSFTEMNENQISNSAPHWWFHCPLWLEAVSLLTHVSDKLLRGYKKTRFSAAASKKKNTFKSTDDFCSNYKSQKEPYVYIHKFIHAVFLIIQQVTSLAFPITVHFLLTFLRDMQQMHGQPITLARPHSVSAARCNEKVKGELCLNPAVVPLTLSLGRHQLAPVPLLT